jgi:hypothetical protein
MAAVMATMISMIFLSALFFCLGIEAWAAYSGSGPVPFLDAAIRLILATQIIYLSHKWYRCACDWRDSVEAIREEIEKAKSLEEAVVIVKSAEEQPALI